MQICITDFQNPNDYRIATSGPTAPCCCIRCARARRPATSRTSSSAAGRFCPSSRSPSTGSTRPACCRSGTSRRSSRSCRSSASHAATRWRRCAFWRWATCRRRSICWVWGRRCARCAWAAKWRTRDGCG